MLYNINYVIIISFIIIFIILVGYILTKIKPIKYLLNFINNIIEKLTKKIENFIGYLF